MKRLRRYAAPLAALAVMLLPTRAEAQANYRELPIGGRTATMGGAGTAAGNDSAMPYLNPAGLAGVPGDIFAISATVYSYTHRSFKDFFFPSGTPPLLGYQQDHESFATNSIGELPSSVMYFKRIGDPESGVQHHIGFSLVIPSARSVDIVGSVAGHLTSVAGEDLETASLTSRTTRYFIGPTYAVGLGDRLRLGVSLYGYYARSEIASNSTSSESLLGGASTASFSGQSSQIAQSLALAPIVGVQWHAVSDAWVGAGLALPTIPLTGRLQFVSSSGYTTPDPTTFVSQTNANTSTMDARYQASMPMRVNAGVAWEHRRGLSVAFDVQYVFAGTSQKVDGVQSFEDRRSGDLTRRYSAPVAFTTHVDSVLDFSAGAELALSDLFALRAGAFTDAAAIPPLGTTRADLSTLRLDRYGATLGLGILFGSFDTTLGGVIVRGTGRYGAADNWITGGVVPVESTETTAMVVLSGAVTTNEAKRIISQTVHVRPELLPDFDRGAAGLGLAPRVPSPLPAEPKPPPPSLPPAGGRP